MLNTLAIKLVLARLYYTVKFLLRFFEVRHASLGNVNNMNGVASVKETVGEIQMFLLRQELLGSAKLDRFEKFLLLNFSLDLVTS